MNLKGSFLLLLVMVVLGGCATTQTVPSVMVLPSPGKPFEVFQSDDRACRQWAGEQIGESPEAAANKQLAWGAAIGTGLGAALGAAIGSFSADAGAGALIGAIAGLIGGTAMASGPAYGAGSSTQWRYDIAYQQCMYAKGNQVPGAVQRPRRAYVAPPPPPGYSHWVPAPAPPDAYPPPRYY